MVLLIGGHQRSGTTLLRNLCDSHHDITVTNEFGNFLAIGRSYKRYSLFMLKRWRRVRNKRAFDSSYANKRIKILNNLLFVMRYLFKIFKHNRGTVDINDIEAALRSIFPHAIIVGEKWPGIVFLLDKFIETNNFFLLMIYRDCRDVVSSTLKQARTNWRRMTFAKKVDTADKVAERWVRTIESMERHKDKLHIIRYEDLVENPKQELESLSWWLGVNPAGFSEKKIRYTSIGKYKKGLSDEELEIVMNIAGSTMARLGYLS